ncbi:agmatinase [Phaeobacter gallaeciensis]|uniref:agmatinase n=1 Tax=Phaeobacter gallaeciensis TaxID=60890 RepID=UPI00237FC6D8|nr:agmatinase [Phaeobacter gallaeciensis]MDE4191853.1 agmatinase [Phaeobacter gallaeciensis]MDE4200316.1 agmatinase [Phaeobacter gallaeciensis]MDE4204236.1 agmatinase [Phaeobacter gallaeciensis]MDE4208608.1 agmatinase [Phaeobacter gallaeciensis]MDE4216745.1 agmatinase [Phaeobacter gallaeciensis]
MTDPFFHPVSGFDVPRFAGVPTFMRLPHLSLDDPRLKEVQVGLIGTPWDSGTTNRPGPRHGPRQLRDMSTMIRAQNGATGVRPFEMVNCADLGDVGPNPADLHDSMDRITQFYDQVVAADVIPLTGGGDHLCSLPILRALGKSAPLGMIHFDSHTDLFKDYFGGTQYTHGTPFRRAIEEGLLDPKRVVQIGIRGTTYDSEDRDFADAVGVRVIAIEEFHARGSEDVMAEAREIAGSQPAYVSYDIDFVDPAFAPGTGTPEVGGPNSFQALQVARLLKGVNIVGADLVEVSPPFDQSGATAFLGVSIMFEILCNLALALGEYSE